MRSRMLATAIGAALLLGACSSLVSKSSDTTVNTDAPAGTDLTTKRVAGSSNPVEKTEPSTGTADAPAVADGPDTSAQKHATDPSTTDASTTDSSSPSVAANQVAAPGCGLDEPAFCDTFDEPKGDPTTRSGDLDPMVWGVSRTNTHINLPSQLSTWFPAVGYTQQMSAPLEGCKLGITPDDVKICNGRLFEAVNDGEDAKTNLGIYPKQPMDFSNGADIVFDASMDGRSNHSAWPEIWVTDQPVPATNGDEEGLQAAARNAIGIQFTGCMGDSGRTTVGVSEIATTTNYTTTTADVITDGCVKSSHASTTGALNHVRIHITPTEVTAFATDPGSSTEVQLAHATIASTLPSNRGLVWWNDIHYNACKFPDDRQCDHVFAIDNFGFSGPKTYRDYTYDVVDAKTPVGDGAVDLGYLVQDDDVVSLKTTAVGDVPKVPKAVEVLFNIATYDTHLIPDIRLNGGAWVSTDWPYTSNRNFYNSLAVVIPDGTYVPGPNTIEFRLPGRSGVVLLQNINLALVDAAPVP